MDEKERKELIEKIKDRVSVWDDKEYHFKSDRPKVELKTGNKYFVDRATIKDGKFRLAAFDDPMYFRQLSLEQLTDDSLERISDELPLTFTIYVSYHDSDSGYSAPILTEPVRANFDNCDVGRWLVKNFPLLDWEFCDNKFICYTQFIDHTGPYLCAVLLKGE